MHGLYEVVIAAYLLPTQDELPRLYSAKHPGELVAAYYHLLTAQCSCVDSKIALGA